MLMYSSKFGEMSERFKEPVLKTGDPATGRGFESHSLRHFLSGKQNIMLIHRIWSGTQEAEGAPLLRE